MLKESNMGFPEPKIIIEQREYSYLLEISSRARELLNLIASNSTDKDQLIAISECKEELSNVLHWLEKGN